eukprot:101103-Rhodomonas_salina.1
MILPVEAAEAGATEDLSEEDDEGDEHGGQVDTSEGSVVMVPHPEDEDGADEVMADDEPAAGPRQGRGADA